MTDTDGPFVARRVLVLGPHTDDAELGSGATIARLVRERAQVTIVAFSPATESVPSHLAPNINHGDAVIAARAIGVPEHAVEILNFPVRHFSAHRQEILDAMIELRSSLDPEIVLGPCSTDRHQDHTVIHQEMLRAFSRQSILGYELPWNCTEFSATCHLEIDDRDLAAKVEALASYRSQEARSYFSPDFIRSWAVMRGTQASMPLAEAFEVLHWRIDL